MISPIFRRLQQVKRVSIGDSQPLPRMEEFIDSLDVATVLSALNANGG